MGEGYDVLSFACRRHPKATIAVLTFYKGQLLEVMRTLAASLKVDLHTPPLPAIYATTHVCRI
jgi:hypothetical protein